MSGRCFVDTNILVYAHDRTAGTKHNQARELTQTLWSSGLAVISTQVLQELYSSLRRKSESPIPLNESELILRDYLEWNVVVNTPQSVLDAIALENRYRISFWDGLILQAALRAKATILYTEDLPHGQSYESLRVVNPFLS